MRYALFSFLFTLIFASAAFAVEGHHSLGVQAGQVGLSGDVGNAYGNALGVGAFFDYAASDWLEFELAFLTSKHNNNNLNLTQNVYSALLQYDIDQFDIFTPYIKGGAEFASHTQDYVGVGDSGVNTTGFGLVVGIGAKVDLGKNLMAALDFDYHDIFDVSVTPPGYTSSVKAIQSFYTIMLRLGFTFGGGK